MKKAIQLTFIILLFASFGFHTTQAGEQAAASSKEVYIHYMAGYSAGQTGSNWTDGTVREPMIGYYNSQSWATHLYQILLSSAAGIDGMVVSVRSDYDEASLKAVLPSLKRITDVDASFDYKIAVNYNDQDKTQEMVEIELTALKDEIMASTSHYLLKDGEPVIFFWDNSGFLSSDNYRTAISNVFTANTPVLLRNEIDFGAAVGSVNSFYPWVQGFAADGSNWGEGYINWYSNTSNDKVTADEIDFTTGAVWPGFDDRDVSWGQNRWIDRQDGATYESLWDVVHAKTIDWVIVETWNGWNEGTEIEPSKAHGFTYVNKTAANIAEFKGTTDGLTDELRNASTKVYEAAALIESEARNYDKYYPVLEEAIQSFINGNGAEAIVSLDKIIDDTIPDDPDPVSLEAREVYMHYMGWFGAGESGSHWTDGAPREPLVGYYDSQSWATHLYQILLSSAAGIDGMVVNIRTEYDEASIKAVLPSLKRITDIDGTFDYKIAASYDDQDMTQETVEAELTTLKNEIMTGTNHYLKKDDKPVIFVWDYDGFLTSNNYRTAVSNVFTESTPILLRNEIESSPSDPNPIDSYYPWVQGYATDGSNWGGDYLSWFYETISDKLIAGDIDYSTGAVWPGFDDREASWGQNRWIDRQDGATYESTWDVVHSKTVEWVIIETWNDWNEGTEIEPSKAHGFTYVNKTATNIAEFKGTTSGLTDELLTASTKIYEAAALIESEARDYGQYYSILEDAIQEFINGDGAASVAHLNKIIDDVLKPEPKSNDETKRVYMHYLGWYSEGSEGNHWKDGTAQEPIIGFYDSQAWSTHLYHMLLSSAVGIDGMVVNVRTEYDEQSLKKILPSLQRIVDVKEDFEYSIAVSYDDQDMTQATAETELSTLRDEVLPATTNYLYKNDEPVVFIWNYDGFLTSDDYREAVTNVFTEDVPILLRNEIDMEASVDAIDSYYPWVQGFDAEGLNWGEEYLDWYYRTLKIREDITFSTGAVWPGFDDRKASWGQDRWIDRKEGETYDQTWTLAQGASDDAEIGLNWVILETWNDWNEGTEIEPSKEHAFTYVTKTAENIAKFKDTTIPVNDDLLAATTKIYQAAQLIESEVRDYDEFYPILEQAIAKFLENEAAASIVLSDQVITPATVLGGVDEVADSFSVYPNPTSATANFSFYMNKSEKVSITVFDTRGEVVDYVISDHLRAGHHSITWNAKGQTGLFILQIQRNDKVAFKKFIVK